MSIIVDKTQESLSLAIGMSEEEFVAFGEKITEIAKQYADIILSGPEEEITRLDILETLGIKLTEKELLLLALTSFEDILQQTITFIQEKKAKEAGESANAITDADIIEDAEVVGNDEPATETVKAEIIEAPYEPSSAPMGETPN